MTGCCGSGSVEPAPQPNVEQAQAPVRQELAFISKPEYEGSLFWFYAGTGEKQATWKHCDFIVRSRGRIWLKTAEGVPIGAYDIDETAWLAAIYGNAIHGLYPPNETVPVRNTGTRVLKVTSSGEPRIDLIFRFPTGPDSYRFLKYCKHHIGKEKEFLDANTNREFADLQRANDSITAQPLPSRH